MTRHDDFDRTLAGWFEAEAAAPVSAESLERVLDATRRRRPRPRWLAGPGSHWVGEASAAGSSFSARWIPRLSVGWSTALILLLAMAALVGGAIAVGSRLFEISQLPTGRLGHLAYGIDGDIYLADWDGGNSIRVADGLPHGGPIDCGSFWGEGPMWSPDGRHFAYRSDWGAPCRATGSGKVHLSDAQGRVVASFPGTGWLVSWSPDSARVATWVELSQTIGIYGLDGVRQALLTLPPGLGPTGDYDPVWSPDGASLLIRLGPPSPSVVWEIPIDGRAGRPVQDEDTRSEYEARYSRDGARVAFIPYFESRSLVMAEADGTVLRVLAGAPAEASGPPDGVYHHDPIWSPTADRVAFIWSDGFMFDQSVDPFPRTDELRVVDVASGAMTTLAHSRGLYSFDVIAFSPEGDRILFARRDADDAMSLWSVRADGSDARLLVEGTNWGDWQAAPNGS